MAVAPIKSIGIIGLMSELDKVIKVCGQSQVFHPDEATHFYSDTKNFVPIADKNPYSDFLSELEDLLQLAGIKPEYTETRRFQVNETELRGYLDRLDEELGGLIREHTVVEQQMEQCRRSLEETSHFFGMDLEMDKINACKFIKANFGRLPKESYQKLDAYSDNPFLVFFPCTSDETHYWGVYIAPVEKSEDIDRIFRRFTLSITKFPVWTARRSSILKSCKASFLSLKSVMMKPRRSWRNIKNSTSTS